MVETRRRNVVTNSFMCFYHNLQTTNYYVKNTLNRQTYNSFTNYAMTSCDVKCFKHMLVLCQHVETISIYMYT